MMSSFGAYVWNFFRFHWLEKILAFVFAIFIWWLSVNTEQNLVTVVKPALILYSGLAEQYVVDSELLNEVQVTLQMEQNELKMLQNLQILVDLKDVVVGKNLIRLQPKDLIGSDSIVLSIEPQQLVLQVEPLLSKLVPVLLKFDSSLSEQDKKLVLYQPQNVLVSGAKTKVNAVDILQTEVISFKQLAFFGSLQVELDVPEKLSTGDLSKITVNYQQAEAQ